MIPLPTGVTLRVDDPTTTDATAEDNDPNDNLERTTNRQASI